MIVEARDAGARGTPETSGRGAVAPDLFRSSIAELSNAELSLSLGRENVVHAAVKPGRIAERLIFESARLKGFRRLTLGLGRIFRRVTGRERFARPQFYWTHERIA